MLRPHGYCRIDGGLEGLIEEDTIKCQHCQKIGFMQMGGRVFWPQITPPTPGATTARVPRGSTHEQYMCRQCYDPICPSCANKPCRHFEKWLEKVEAQGGMIRLNRERLQELAYKAARAIGLS